MTGRSTPAASAAFGEGAPQTNRHRAAPASPATGLDVDAVRDQFPIFAQPLDNGRPLTFLDSGASTQKPRCVLDKGREVYETYYANAYRGVYRFGARVDEELEAARDEVRGLLNAERPEEIAFVGGATVALNMIAFGWGRRNLKPGDRVAVDLLQHHANLVPWQQVARETGAELVYLPLTDDGRMNLPAAADLMDERVRLVAVTGMSNVFGTMPDVAAVSEMARSVGALTVVDGSQSVPHRATDVRGEGADFLVFGGHKLYGPTGIGVLYGRHEVLEQTDPIIFGGHMIDRVGVSESTWAPPPAKFEAGTLPIVQAIGLGEAVRFVRRIGLDAMAAHEHDLLVRATEQLTSVPGVRILGPPVEHKGAIVSFTIEGANAQDVAMLLDRRGVFVRHGHHCTMPLHESMSVPASIRASFAVYNRPQDVEALIDGLLYARQKLRLDRGDD